MVTCIAGEDAPLERAAIERLVPRGIELDYHQGDQPSWWYLIAAE